jgi:hypothetical protein
MGIASRFISKFVDLISYKNYITLRKIRNIAPQEAAEYSFPSPPGLRSARRSGSQKRKASKEQEETPAPTEKRLSPDDSGNPDF